MSNDQSRSQPFDYSPPARSGSGGGALALIGGIIVLFLLAMLFFGGGSSPLPQDGAAPAAVTPADGAPTAVPEAVIVDPAAAPVVVE